MKKIKIGVICSLDKFANKERATEIVKYFRKRGCHIDIINTYHQKNSFSKQVNSLSRFYSNIPFYIKQYFLLPQMILRSLIIERIIRKKKYNIVICENEIDSLIFTRKLNCLTILDSPAPWIDELYFGKDINWLIYKILRRIEIYIYSHVDYLNFHWDNYTKYVKKYIYNGPNIITCNFGCNPVAPKMTAKFDLPLKVVFLGKLDGSWNNLQLLSELSKRYPIHVYGGPEPPAKYNLDYRGYAPSTAILNKYQLGLVTITSDNLRRSSFSSKHLKYMCYGLPVLTPKWCKDSRLKSVSTYYDLQNFKKLISMYSNREVWLRQSRKSYHFANSNKWDIVLKPFDEIVSSYKNINE